MDIMKYVGDVNILLVVIDILFLIVSFLFFDKKRYSTRVKDIFVIGYTLGNLFLFAYFNSMFQGLFTLKLLSVRVYLILVLITLIIFLYTFNKKVKLVYNIFNYLLSGIVSIILLVNIYIVISNKINFSDAIEVNNSITLMNISNIIFFVYLGLIELSYIGVYLYDLYLLKNSDKGEYIEEVTKNIDTNKKDWKKKRKISGNKKNEIMGNKTIVSDNGDDKVSNNNSLDLLFNYKVGDDFYINGIECSIIFCDSNKENIMKNYEILSSDISARMVNGFTLKENIMIRDICSKLNINNLGSIDMNNLSLLNIISVDEYNFLKKIIN